MANGIGNRDFSHSVRIHYKETGKPLARAYNSVVRPTLKREATIEEAREDAKLAMMVHKMSVILPSILGWTVELEQALAARQLALPDEDAIAALYMEVTK